MPVNKWICESEKELLTSPFMTLVEQMCRSSEDSRPYKFYVFRSRDWGNIIPVTEDGKVVLIRQYRIGIAEHTLEIPGGVIDPQDENGKAAALRELGEETGYVPLPGARCECLGSPHANPAIQNNRCHTFIVGPVRKAREQKLDEGEMIEVVEVPIAELPGMIARGEISHALMLMGFLFLMLQSDEGLQLLRKQLGQFSQVR